MNSVAIPVCPSVAYQQTLLKLQQGNNSSGTSIDSQHRFTHESMFRI